MPKCSDQLQKICDRLNLNQTKMFKDAGLSRQAMYNYMGGTHEPRFSPLQIWGQMYRINMNWLFFGEGEMFRPAPQSSDNEASFGRPEDYPNRHLDTQNAIEMEKLRLMREQNDIAEQARRDMQYRAILGTTSTSTVIGNKIYTNTQ